MTALDKPRPILTPTISVHGRWRFLVVTLSVEERRALAALASARRHHPADVAAELVREGLERRSLLPLEYEYGRG